MAITIETRYEKKRGCGYRKPGGLYFVAGEGSRPCGKLPVEVAVCPCCGQGIRQTRGFSWVSSALIDASRCKGCEVKGESGCFPFSVIKRYGLMWVGEKFYKTPAFFTKEAALQGISKRLPFIPKDFAVGVDWVLLAHPKTPFYTESGTELRPAIFMAFKPRYIEYVVKGTESEEELQALADRGITLVQVKRWEERPKPIDVSVPQLNLN